VNEYRFGDIVDASGAAPADRQHQLIVPLLVGALGDEDPFYRGQSARILAEIGPFARDSAPALLDALNDTDKFVRMDVIRALQRTGDHNEAILPALLACLKDRDDVIRLLAADLLSQMSREARSLWPMLLWTALTDKNPEIRSSASVSLNHDGAT
jgi:HEAT repeat protein